MNQQRLDNLIWVWSPNTPEGGGGSLADYFPVPDYVDVLGMDIYHGFKQEFYDELPGLAAGKPIAMGEAGKLPTPAVLDAQPKWVWFMAWDTSIMGRNNPPEAVKTIFNDPGVLSRGQLHWK